VDPERLLARMPWRSLWPLLLGSDSEREAVIARLRLFAGELLRWNRGVSNLVSHDDEARLVERHLAESLAGLELVNTLGGKHILDFGSGGGFPAIPLVLAGAGERWTLVESRRNKTLFLRRAVQELGLSNVSVVTGRLETLVAETPEAVRADALTSRATLKLGPTLELAAQVVPSGGAAILWKGSGVHEELAAIGESVRAAWNEPRLHAISEDRNSIIAFTRR
jgi:16S rRNA (guanine527-N7)-methyltransferase